MAGHWSQLVIYALIVLNSQVHGRLINPKVKITIVEDAVAKGAVCLDGSPAGYHYSDGLGDGANHWLVYLAGGGWCGTTRGCLDRVKENPGVSSTYNITHTYFDGILSPNQTINPDFYNWTRVYVRYCDGSSFMGDVEAVDPETKLHYRGSRIYSAVVDELLAKGLKNAHKVILAGNSAGGLATILHCDRFRELVPNATRVKCISDSGFFIHAKDLPNADVRELTFANMVALHGVAKFLPTSCTSRMAPALCLFPENLVRNVQTPLFLLNSAFDKFQISYNLKPYPADETGWRNCTLSTESCTLGQLQIIRDFKNTFLKTLKDAGDSSSTGLFINTCYFHDILYSAPRWNFNELPTFGNKTVAQVVGDWYFDRSIIKLVDTQTDNPVHCHAPITS
ncbi:hypothetical protein CASFOL_007412 [Castilleja foliolosa]|uniref:Pectin acetylesterase n=1 Tax=Castilleja foliolosa TaxID=1961234 RepID=A0ABD3ED00_9LAMI